MKHGNQFASLKHYSFEKRERAGRTKAAKRFLAGKSQKSRMLLIGFGGTISSGYTPTKETIVPLFPSPAIKQIEYVNLFGIANLHFDHIDLCAKDSRDIKTEDLALLLDILHLTPHRKVLITSGTYMLPKVAQTIMHMCHGIPKIIALTGSILPAGFVASDADANIWSALSVLNDRGERDDSDTLSVFVVFHGRIFETEDALRRLDLHPKHTRGLVIQYPLTTVPTDSIL